MDLLACPYRRLGTERILEFNVALWSKWFWRFSEDRLWARVVREKYGLNLCTNMPNLPKKTIGRSVWHELAKVVDLFLLLTRYSVAMDSSLSFWQSKWLSESTLAEESPHLYKRCFRKFGGNKEFAVGMENGLVQWDFHLPRRLADSETEELIKLMVALEDYVFIEGRALLQWMDGKEVFTVKVCYEKILQLRLNLFTYGVKLLNWRKVWLSKVPTIVNFTIWVLMHDCLLTMENLKKRALALAERCPFYGCCGESSQQISFECEFVQRLWRSLFISIKEATSSDSLVVDLILNWNAKMALSSKVRVLWRSCDDLDSLE